MVITLSPISAPFEGRGHGEQRTRIAVGTSMALEFLSKGDKFKKAVAFFLPTRS